MGSANTVITVSNQALLSIGVQAQVSSLNEGTPQAQAISTLYSPTFTDLARSANWNCLRNQVALTLIAAAQGTPENPDGTTLPLPPVPWLYQYAQPSDCLKVRYIIPSLPATVTGVPIFSVNTAAPTWLPGPGQIPFAVAYAVDSNNSPINVILTNQSQAIAVYTVDQQNPQIWDSLFQSAFVASLAAYLVPALSLHIPLMQAQIAIAERLIMEARTADGNEGTTSMDHVPDFIRARSGANSMVGNRNLGFYNSYFNMSWPSY